MTIQDLSRQILSKHNRESTGFRRDYFEYLTKSSGCYAQISDTDIEIQKVQENSCLSEGVQLLNRVYGLLEPYTLELNRIVNDRSFTITATQPGFIQEESKEDWPYKASQMVQVYRCRFSSRSLSASIRLKENRLEFFILPAGQVIGLSDAEDEFGSLMFFEHRNVDGWSVEGKTLTSDRMERYCLLFFEYFVKNSEKLIIDELSA